VIKYKSITYKRALDNVLQGVILFEKILYYIYIMKIPFLPEGMISVSETKLPNTKPILCQLILEETCFLH